MGKIDPYYELLNTVLHKKKMVVFLGAGASMEGAKHGKSFPGFGELTEDVLTNFGAVPPTEKERLDNFLTVIKHL